MSQLIQRLDRELSTVTDRQQSAELLARKSCALARAGQFEGASELIRSLRRNFGDWSCGQTHVWIMVAEALVYWFSDLSPAALDRITRAQVLSVAMKYRDGIAVSAAWKAHIEFEMSDFDSMIRSLRLAQSSCSEENCDANSRIAIVICNALSCCGEWVAAQKWFTKGRKYALLEGDQAGIDALQYNRAALAITWIRSEQFDGRINVDSIHSARRELESARNYTDLTGISTLRNHLALCDARLTALEQRYSEAAEKLGFLRSDAPFASYHFSNQLIDLEISYCFFKIGDLSAAVRIIDGLDLGAFIDLDIDDRFAVISMLCEMSQHEPIFGDHLQLCSRRAEIRIAHENSRMSLKEGILKLLSEVPN